MEQLAAIVWGPQLMVLMLAVGIVMTVRTGWVQVRKWKQTVRVLRKPAGRRGVTPFQAVCTALAGTVGTGNIAGVSGALALGGPGAVFWMWVSAFFGMATKYAEVVLALRYRKKDTAGQWLGGPMYYISEGMGAHRLAAGFALFALAGSLAMGNVAQVHTVADGVKTAAAIWLPRWSSHSVALAAGVAAAVIVVVATMGGMGRIGRIMESAMPVLAGAYILGSAAVLATHHTKILPAFRQILQGAVAPQAVIGGAAGISLRQAVRWGVSRGVFSNEAGLGSAPMAHAAAEAEPEEQGLLGVFEVFFDTVVLCTLTALTILVSGVPITYGEAAGAELATAALETVFGKSASLLQAVILTFLALGSMISWNLYGSRCAHYLWGYGGERVYQLIFPAVTLLGATMDLSAAWTLADLCNGLMALPNLIALLVLQKQAAPQRSDR